MCISCDKYTKHFKGFGVVFFFNCLTHLLHYDPVIEPIYYPLQSNSHPLTPSIHTHIMTSSIQLTAFPSLKPNLSDLPGMQDIDPNLLHISPVSPLGAASQAKLKAALKHTNSTPSLMSYTCSSPPPSPSSDEFLMMKPTLHGPDRAVQGYHIKQPITLDDNQIYHFKEYIGGSFYDRKGELMCYACFEYVAASSQHHPSTLIVPVHLRVAMGVCSHFGCA